MSRRLRLLLLVSLLAVLPAGRGAAARLLQAPSFAIDYANNTFTLDGAPFRYVSGTVHYFRVLRAYWADRLLRLRALGANVLETYVEWSSHEPEPGQYQFTGEYQLIDELVKYQFTGESGNISSQVSWTLPVHG